MTHLVERNHGERFTARMDAFLPDWRSRRDELNSAPLAHERWGVANCPELDQGARALEQPPAEHPIGEIT
jgi:hypothetical protein